MKSRYPLDFNESIFRPGMLLIIISFYDRNF